MSTERDRSPVDRLTMPDNARHCKWTSRYLPVIAEDGNRAIFCFARLDRFDVVMSDGSISTRFAGMLINRDTRAPLEPHILLAEFPSGSLYAFRGRPSIDPLSLVPVYPRLSPELAPLLTRSADVLAACAGLELEWTWINPADYVLRMYRGGWSKLSSSYAAREV